MWWGPRGAVRWGPSKHVRHLMLKRTRPAVSLCGACAREAVGGASARRRWVSCGALRVAGARLCGYGIAFGEARLGLLVRQNGKSKKALRVSFSAVERGASPGVSPDKLLCAWHARIVWSATRRRSFGVAFLASQHSNPPTPPNLRLTSGRTEGRAALGDLLAAGQAAGSRGWPQGYRLSPPR